MSTNELTQRGKLRGLRINSFAAIVMLLIEFELGITVNLYASLPGSGDGKGLFGAFLSSITTGPIALTLHALLGTLLLITATAAIIRATRAHATRYIVLTSLALLSILLAWISGARFVGAGGNGASLVMALATGLALLFYAVIVFTA